MFKIFLLFLFFFYTQICSGQDSSYNSRIYALAIQNAINHYYDSRGVQAEIYNGFEHQGYLPSIQGFAYFGTPDWQEGKITFNDVLYKNIRLKYDLVKDEVIVMHPNNYSVSSLFSPRVQAFSFGNYKFIYLENAKPLKEGFYQQLTDGKLSILIKRSKKIDEKIERTQIERKFFESNQYYALLNGAYYPIKNEKSILNLLKEYKTEIKQALANKGIKFRTNPEQAILTIAEYYNNQISK